MGVKIHILDFDSVTAELLPDFIMFVTLYACLQSAHGATTVVLTALCGPMIA